MSNTVLARPERRAASPAARRMQTQLRWDQIERQERPAALRVALLASFTANPLTPYLGVALDQAGLTPALWVGPYNQIMPQCLAADSELAHQRPDLLVCWPRLEELWGLGDLPLSDPLTRFCADAEELAEAVLGAAGRLGATLLFVLPAPPLIRPLGLGDAANPRGVAAAAAAARELLRRRLAGQPGVLLLDADDLVREVGLARAYNQRSFAVARIPFSEELFELAGERMARLVALGRRAARLLVAVAPDNVLWGGQLERLGAQGVDLNEGGPGECFRQVQHFLLELRRAGVTLALCGDTPAGALEAVLDRREMLLRSEHLTLAPDDRRPLPERLAELAARLGFAPAEVVLLAGDADLLDQAREALPGLRGVAMPEQPEEWLGALQGCGALDLLPPDAPADEPPAADAPRLGGLDAFLARLGLEVQVLPAEPAQIAHLAHLTEQTADFHLTGQQRSEAELAALLADGTHLCWGVHVRDRLGDYGIAGALIAAPDGPTLAVDTFLLNCRVLGRQVEQRVLEQLAAIAGARGCEQVRLTYRRTARNAVAGAFVSALAGDALRQQPDGFSATLPLAALAARAPAPAVPTAALPAAAPVPAGLAALLERRWRGLPAAERAALPERFAALRNATQLEEAVRQHRRRARPDLSDEYVAPRNDLEARLSAVWARVLGVERVGVRDNFFHLGGHSILATQLVIQLQDALAVELPVRIFFETPTIESMAQAIEIIQRTGDDSAFTALAPTYIKAEAVLDPAIVPGDARPAEHVDDPRDVLLTGATGFVGAFLLAELLRRTRARVHCLVRAADQADAAARLRANLQRYMLWDEALAARLVPIAGDLARPLLGLSAERFAALAETIDSIYHAGAVTNFIYPYSTLKPANVLGSQEVLRLACRTRLKPVHFISTLYVFAPQDRPTGRAIREEDVAQHIDTLHIGYRQSKWVAEQLMLIARERGLPVNIYRPGRIAGHSRSGACQTNDFVWRMIKACVEVASVMDQDMVMDLTPVDYVCEAAVHLSLQPGSLGRSFHLINPRQPLLSEIISWMRDYGYPIRRESYSVWRGRLKENAERSPHSAAYALIPFLPEVVNEDQLGDLPFDQRNTHAALDGSPITCPEVDSARFTTYLNYFIQSRFLDAPHPID